ncbi:4'-phosphopantetheinyl transferase superfamily protein [Ramlibacter monticola]|uniref:4'-phosphopantetheinyl transferase superfamily protein n=1 Tax=Ramlibacter monticola TaxID=1926872 RepID=A0A937CRU6_9BURK|nr:4'-phosphopantetheinyl transferase superfamily protein [Ramlibacter monticola]MBL0389778.1 4'-phosphopantetheinyl transferase superfamily protein [Ramlibacter monticola]
MNTRVDPLQVHLFCLDALRAQAGAVSSAEEELLDVAGVRSPGRRAEIVYGRAALRGLLAKVTGARPDELRLRRDDRGKPSAVLASGQPVQAFNVSHSNGVLAIAIGPDAPAVGVDVEGPAPGLAPDVEALARSHFSPAERAEVLGAAANERMRVFMRVWTLKEAVLKTTGDGLAHPLRTVEVSGARGTLHCQLGAQRLPIYARHLRLAPAWHLAVARYGELPPVTLHWMTALPALGPSSHAHADDHACPSCRPVATAVAAREAGAAMEAACA